MSSASTYGAEDEPPTISPFGPVRQDRDDALPGYLETSDGKVLAGSVYMTRDKRLKLDDRQAESNDVRQREIPLRVVKQIECHVEKEWMEKEWRFKEAASNEKVFTGRTYPARAYTHTVTLNDGRKITGNLAEILYVRPFASAQGARAGQERPEAQRFFLHKRDKGEIGENLKSLVYVRLVKLGEEALEEGKAKAEKQKRKNPKHGTRNPKQASGPGTIR